MIVAIRCSVCGLWCGVDAFRRTRRFRSLTMPSCAGAQALQGTCLGFRLSPPALPSGRVPHLLVTPSPSFGIETANQGGSERRRRPCLQPHPNAVTFTPKSPTSSSPPSKLIRASRVCRGAAGQGPSTCRSTPLPARATPASTSSTSGLWPRFAIMRHRSGQPTSSGPSVASRSAKARRPPLSSSTRSSRARPY